MQLGILATEFTQNGESYFGIQSNYIRFVSKFGNAELITPTVTLKKLKELDGIFLPGGPDVDPKRYGATPSYWTGKPSQYLEYFDTSLLPHLLGKVPIVGICRGLQTINVVLGGTLIQHIYFNKNPTSTHDKDLVHDIITLTSKFKVNSFHHQGIDKLADGLEPLATTEFGLIEAIWSSPLKVFAVQWHPERMEIDPWTEEKILELLKGE